MKLKMAPQPFKGIFYFIVFFVLICIYNNCEPPEGEDIGDPIQRDTIFYDTTEIGSFHYDTIKPKPYFPVYPGSCWKYRINDSIEIISAVQEKYKLHNFRTSHESTFDENGNRIIECSKPEYVPFLDNEPIYGYNKVEHIEPPFGDYYQLWPILSDAVGFEFNREFTDGRHGDQNEHVKVLQKILRNNDSILILKGHWVPNDFVMEGGHLNYLTFQEYQKNVGLINYYIIDTTILDTIYKKELIEYFINN